MLFIQFYSFFLLLQEFVPSVGHYNVIWCQWVLRHIIYVMVNVKCFYKTVNVLSLADLIAFLKRCVNGLVPHTGIIIVKENIAQDDDEFDDTDSSVTR